MMTEIFQGVTAMPAMAGVEVTRLECKAEESADNRGKRQCFQTHKFVD